MEDQNKPFNNKTDCWRCHNFIDGETVTLKRIITDDNGKWEMFCRNCVSGNPVVRDVYYGYGSGTHTEENICNPETGQPIPFSSREGKYQAMKQAGVVEAGDKIHGARTTFRNRK